MIAIDMVLQRTKRIEPVSALLAFETFEVGKIALEYIKVSDA